MNIWRKSLILCILSMVFARPSMALTANRVWFEFHPYFYRVKFSYTLVALKRKRMGYVDFRRKRPAEIFYFKLLRGADFYFGEPDGAVFFNPPPQPDPW
ncbi:MAG: hypothetical protein OXT67_07910 [Zetaproteobacteria bacterium]|nr:hypothetical protein [Zetaproteobacteria bacterium]